MSLRYSFGYTTELSSRAEPSVCTAKRLRQRLQRQQSGHSDWDGFQKLCSDSLEAFVDINMY
ncbi:hypothetical protein ANCCEY_06092 [Ancylostoma ceylanicum]|uniref:Uncharacterized protein n=1 Tax=Ancylostoma ceylanicum TaxID=53326 RepID=A0A0D6LSJ6_9BILA|nr:hypothetical protein ANCCEY_06092 [Ancylostoma ceylanicum]